MDKAVPPKPNISKHEAKALKSLKKDKSRMVLTADKGNCFVVMDTEDYVNKCNQVLSDTETYERLDNDPTSKYHKKLCDKLMAIKKRGEPSQEKYQKLRPSGRYTPPPKFYGSPKIHKKGVPMRPIISSIATLAYNVAKSLTDIRYSNT